MKAIIIDVREKEEWDMGHGKHSILLPLSTLESNIKSIEKFKDDKIVLVCRSGNRAGIAKNILEKNGFKNLENGGSWEDFK